MASFITHGMIGAAGTVLAMTHDPFEPSIVAAAVAWVCGTLPDSADWIASRVFGRPEGSLYTRMHSGDLVWLGFICPPILWHLLFDIFFHERPGENWWPRLWWLEVSGFLLSVLVLLWIFLR